VVVVVSWMRSFVGVVDALVRCGGSEVCGSVSTGGFDQSTRMRPGVASTSVSSPSSAVTTMVKTSAMYCSFSEEWYSGQGVSVTPRPSTLISSWRTRMRKLQTLGNSGSTSQSSLSSMVSSS